MLSDLYLRTKQLQLALKAITHTEKLAPEQPQIQIFKINCQILTGNNNLALQTANNLLSKNKQLLAKDWLNLGVNFHQLNSLKNAHHCFVNAVEIEPLNSHFRFNLATSFRNIGNIKQSEIELKKNLALNPNDWDGFLARTLLKKHSLDDNNIAELKQKIALKKNKEAQSKLLFSLAKEQEDCALYVDSFKSLKQANDLRNEFTQYNISHDIEAMECIRTTFTQANKKITDRLYTTTKQPVFIVGLPRTGTTLLERIISQHPQVLAAGELHDFSSCLTKATIKSSTTPLTNKVDFIQQTAKVDFSELGQAYIQSTSMLTTESPIFIDKMPLNFLYTGLIQQALPHAKIIHLTRSPMAACYAIYKTSFGQAYPFSYNLDNLVKYYIAYRKLMSHWQQENQANFIEINYEQLVTSPALVGKEVFDFLSLDWQEEYLQLENNKQASATASSSQVRGGIYQSSVELWRNYHNELTQFRQTLAQANINPEKW
jgi:tetratricopeptide (TPR) repeat protein